MVSIETALLGGEEELGTRVYETSLAKCGRTSSAKTPHSLFILPNTKSIVQNAKSNICGIPNSKYQIHHHPRLPLPSVGVKALPTPTLSIHHMPIHHLLSWPYFVIMNKTIRGRWSLLSNLTLYLFTFCLDHTPSLWISFSGVEVSCQVTHFI